LHFELQRKDPDNLSIHLEGLLDRQTVPKIRKELLKAAKKSGVSKVEVDLSRVSGLDTAGIALMVELLRVLSNRHGKLRLTGLNEHSIKMIRLSRLDALFQVNNHAGKGIEHD
jgi:anti-sigma B factor antagonist